MAAWENQCPCRVAIATKDGLTSDEKDEPTHLRDRGWVVGENRVAELIWRVIALADLPWLYSSRTWAGTCTSVG